MASTMGGGNWLLHDEIMLTVGYTSQFLDFVKSVGAGVEGTKAGAGLFSLAHNVVKRLQHLSSSFFTVIFQEGIKCFQKEEPSGILSYTYSNPANFSATLLNAAPQEAPEGWAGPVRVQ